MRPARISSRTLSAILFALATAVAAPAFALPTGIYITDHEIDTKSPSFEKDLKKAQKAVIKKEGATWKLFFVAYLKKAPGAEEVNLVFYDITTKTKEAPNAVPVMMQPNAKILASTVEISEEMNFQAGHKYDVRVTRLISGKEEVYATTKLELK